MNSNKIIYLLAAVVLVGAVVLYAVSKRTTPPAQTTIAVTPTMVPLTSSPNVPTPIPVIPTNFKGTVTEMSGTNVTVKSDSGETKTFSLGPTRDIQIVTSGDMTAGNVKTKQTTVSDIKVGSQIYLISDKRTGNVVGVLIIKQ